MLLVNLSNLPWVSKRMKRNQAIFHHLLAHECFEEGVYLNPPAIRNISTEQAWRLPYVADVAETEVNGKRVNILQPVFTLPFTWRKPVMDLSAALIARSLHRRIVRGRKYLLWMNSIEPMSQPIATKLAAAADIRIFDSSDDFVEFERSEPARTVLQASLKKILSAADRVLAVNEHVLHRLDHPHKREFQNCTDFENFQQVQAGWSLPPYFPKPQGAVYVGFVGGLYSTRVDVPLLRQLFTRFPAARFLFVGYTNEPAIRTWVNEIPNAAFLPEVPYDILPTVIRSFDVAIVPHLDNEMTRGNDLLKVLDYFACGVPVITTRCSNVEKYTGACCIANGHEEFVELVGRALDGSLPHNPDPGLEAARTRSWRRQVPGLVPWILGHTDSK